MRRIVLLIPFLADKAWAEAALKFSEDGSLLAFGSKVLLCLGGLLIALYLLRRRRKRWTQGGDLRVLASAPLGGKERAVLLEVIGERVLLGVSEGRVTALLRLRREVQERGEQPEEVPLRDGWPRGNLPFDLEEKAPWRPLPEVVKALERDLTTLKDR